MGRRPGAAVQFAHLAQTFDRLASESSRLGMTRILADLLAELEPEDIAPVMYLMQGAVRPEWEAVELGLAEKSIVKAIAQAAGLDAVGKQGVARVTERYHELGDLGLAAEGLLAERAGSKQTGLFAFGAKPPQALEVREAYQRLLQIAGTGGQDSQTHKQRQLEALLSAVTPEEARYLVRFVAGRLRLGVADMTVLDALAAWHLQRGVRSVQEMSPEERAEQEGARATLERAYDLRSDLSLVAETLARGGLQAVAELGIAVGTPLRPMLAERSDTLADILNRHGGATVVETKYDGLRMQVHVEQQEHGPARVRLFSRRLEDLTAAFPDVVATVQAASRGGATIVEGECVAWDPATGRLRPFQDVSRRRGRKTGLGGTVQTLSGEEGARAGLDITREVPVVLFLFDALAVDGDSLLHEPYLARRTRIEERFDTTPDGALRLAAAERCATEAEMEQVFQRVVQEGGEGIMCKRPDGIYKAGGRGYDWIKFKADYQEGLADSMDLVVVGAFHGRGRRAGWYGALLMACRTPTGFASVCKLGTGFDDATLAGLKGRLSDAMVPARPSEVEADLEPDVWFRPQAVAEVQAAELTLSPIHPAARGVLREGYGLAARFPRFAGWREDKGPADATTADELVTLYRAQQQRRTS
jgi:DNA ligase 1